jgi:fatty acid desaturase
MCTKLLLPPHDAPCANLHDTRQSLLLSTRSITVRRVTEIFTSLQKLTLKQHSRSMPTTTDDQKPTEVRIGDTLYDVKDFKHPGGGIIKLYMGANDATQAYTEMHHRSAKAAKYLKTLPNRPAPASVTASAYSKKTKKFTDDFAAMVKRLHAEGWYDMSLAHTVYRCAEIFAMHAVGIYLLLCTSWYFTALLIIGIVQGRCGWYMHEGGHLSITGNIKTDMLMHEFFYGVGCGMSGAWWRIQHNKHHAMPQKLKGDPDLDTLPFIAFNKLCYDGAPKSAFAKKWVPLQAFLFAPVSCSLVTLSWQYFLHPRHIFRRKLHREALFIALRHVAIVLMALYAGATFWQSVGTYLIYNSIGGTYIFVNFAVSHTHLDVAAPNAEVHWLEFASVHTLNCTPHWFTNWWMSYLNFQIEHHLFPSMPQYKFAALYPQVQALFKANDLHYDSRGYFESLDATFRNLHAVGVAVSGEKTK